MFSGGNRASERNHTDFFVTGQRISYGFAATKQHVQHAWREDIFRQFRQLQRRQRGNFRWLDDDTVSRRQRGRQLPRRHHQRIVPGRDRGDNANRVAADHRGMSFEIFSGSQPVQAASGSCKEAKHIDHGRDLIPLDAVQRFPAVKGLQFCERVSVGFYHISQFQQTFGARFRRRLSPLCERAIGSLDGSVHLCCRRFSHLQQHFTRGRIINRLLLTFAGHQFTINQQLILHSIVLLKSTLFSLSAHVLAGRYVTTSRYQSALPY